MPRYALLLEYDGTGFVGWQVQDNGLSLQGVLEAAAARLAGGAPVASVVAGRTDAGVHAEGQVAQIDLPAGFAPERLRDALNFHMKPHRHGGAAGGGGAGGLECAVLRHRPGLSLSHPEPRGRGRRCWRAGSGTSSIRWTRRRWRRRRRACWAGTISPRSAPPPARPKARCARSTGWTCARSGDMVEIVAEARSFLHHQVRNMVGTLKLVGEGAGRSSGVARALWPPATAAPPGRPRRPEGS